VLERLQRQAERRAAENSRARRVEELGAAVAVRPRRLAEAEARGDERDSGAGTGERRRQLVVVLRREGGWIGEHDAHWAVH
jgi:hypothetical protein